MVSDSRDRVVGGRYRMLESGAWVGSERILWVNQGMSTDRSEPVLILFISPKAKPEQIDGLFEYIKRDQRLKVHRSGVYNSPNQPVSYVVLDRVSEPVISQLYDAWLHSRPWPPTERIPTPKEKEPPVDRRKTILLVVFIFLLVAVLLCVLLVISGTVDDILKLVPTLTPTVLP